MDVWLFSYGTLQQDEVQLATFGRLLEGRVDALPGYATSLFEIMDAEVVTTSGKTRAKDAPAISPARWIATIISPRTAVFSAASRAASATRVVAANTAAMAT